MGTNKKTASIVGILFIIGTVSGILSAVITAGILDKPVNLVKISENENLLILGAICVLIMGIALAMVPVMMFPILKKHNEVLAMGYIVFRGALETVTYIMVAICWLLLVVLGKDYGKAISPDASIFKTLSNLILGAQEQSSNITLIVFSLGALMFYYLLFHSRLIPRWLSGWGFVSIMIFLPTSVFALFGTTSDLLFMPLAVQEMVMALWLIVKGFNSTAIASLVSNDCKNG